MQDLINKTVSRLVVFNSEFKYTAHPEDQCIIIELFHEYENHPKRIVFNDFGVHFKYLDESNNLTVQTWEEIKHIKF